MASTSTLIKQTCSMKLYKAGSSGSTVSLSIGTLSPEASAWDADKALAIASLIGRLIEKDLESIRYVPTYDIDEQ